MKYFANFKDGELVEIDTGLLSGENCVNTEVPQELYEDYKATPDKYIAGEKEIEIDVIDPETGETHKEPVTVPYPVINPNYEQEQEEKREQAFKEAFFITSLGYVRRSVTMADGTKKDFLSDLLPVISMGVQSGTEVHILTYEEPPFDEDITDWTEYQKQVTVTPQFIQECFMQLSNDFLPINEE